MSKNLLEYLSRCDDAYYNSSTPIVDDATYDALVETLRRINPGHPYLKKIGAKVSSNKVGRVTPMGTLSKLHKDEEVSKWLSSEEGEVLVCPKYDGFAIELVYHEGNLISASTRGDGFVGEDVLAASMRIKSIPISLSRYNSEYITIRGEAIIPKEYHEKVKELGYSAMRNAVPGIVRSNRVEALGYVDYIAYEIIDGVNDRVSQRAYYKEDFILEDHVLYNNDDFENISSFRNELINSDFPYEIDGVVLKSREIKEDNYLHPLHMVAWKYKSNRESTILRDIEYQMGVTGFFTPIGVFDEVEFQGAKLTRASLGNLTRISKEFKGLTLGSVIEVSRRGDIIPYIEKLVLVNEEGKKVDSLTICPHCGESLIYKEEEPRCANKSCPEKLRLQISHYAKSVGIKGIGDKLVRGLIDEGLIEYIIDIYTINPDSILSLPRQGSSAVSKWQMLQEKKLSAIELLTAYPFIDLGKKVWESLIKSGYTYKKLLTATREDLIASNIKGIGESKIESIISQVQENLEELKWLGEYHNVL